MGRIFTDQRSVGLAGVEPTTAELISVGVAGALWLPYFGYVYWTELRATIRPDYKSPAERLAEAEEIWARGEGASPAGGYQNR